MEKDRVFRINFIFILIFFFFSEDQLFAQQSCEALELKLIKLNEKKLEAVTALQKNDKGLMQAKEILLLARAKGDVKAAEVAEEAIKRFEANIQKNKEIIKECEEEIARVEDVLRLCKGDECETIKSRINRTKEALKRAIRDAERQSREYEALQQELEVFREMQDELKRWDNRIEFVLNALTSTTLIPDRAAREMAIEKLRRLAKLLDDSIILSAIQTGKDNMELLRALKNEGERTARALEGAVNLADEIKRDIELSRKLLDAELDITDLISKIRKTRNVFERVIKLNNLLKLNEYIYKTLYINVAYELLGEELNERLNGTDKTIEGIEALKMELKREMEIYKTCRELGRIK